MSAGYGLGIVSVAFGLGCPLPEAARRARALGFDHLDIAVDRLPGGAEPQLAVPVGDRNGAVPETGVTCRLPPGGTWDECVALLRRQPGLRVEPGPRSVLDTAAAVRAMCEEVPGLRITLDTGWAAFCGYDPLEVADLAGHVQLRQARPGRPQVHPDEDGDVVFPAVIEGLAARGYAGLFSVEYFDLPELRLPLADPVGHCLALADRVRPLLAG
ncbi:MAG: sugar phosphate isomerase/epimerase family protein [Acidimicrobiales bacterium]